MLIKRSKPMTSPPALSRASTRDRKQRTKLDFSTSQDSIDDEEDFQPSPPRNKRSAMSLDDDDDDNDDDSDFSDDDKHHVHKKTRIALKSISNKRSTIPTIGKFIPLTNRIHKPNYDAKSALGKKFKIPTMQIKPPSTTKKDNAEEYGKMVKPKKPNNNAAAIAAAAEAANSDFGERKTLGIRRRAGNLRALYDHTAEGAIILWDPDNDHVEEELKITTDRPQKKGKTLAEILGIKKEEKKMVHVVVDPVLGKVLRPHQVEGVQFLYRCTTGQVHPEANGCIMADEMGLGKTLQCITLLWTLLKQSGELGKPMINKAIITCPSSLVNNWANELVKWLGEGKCRPLVISESKTKKDKISTVKRWGAAQGKIINPVLIISYESLRELSKVLKASPIGLLLCDEGHRLKNSSSQLFKALSSLTVTRRVILSGTPIQNDLSEYYSLLDFANPGLLGTPNEFRRHYELPILRGRDADASDKERELSDEKVAEFWKIVSKFTIRRTNDILTKYLPVKYEHVVFCKLAPLQEALYNVFLTSPEIKTLLRGQGSQPLKAITLLKKLCNHPNLLNLPKDLEGCDSILPSGYANSSKVDASYSGKFMVLARMLARIKKETKDKIVLISNYTQTLDVFEAFCQQHQYGVIRLDGSMNTSKRQTLVDRFNDPQGEEFVFLLSSKAGGCGLNLIGANRLVLFDPDWNPAADQQALARVWRDGQKKDCKVFPSFCPTTFYSLILI
ncbi:unnamed protein product [Mucor hiemalis]